MYIYTSEYSTLQNNETESIIVFGKRENSKRRGETVKGDEYDQSIYL